MFQAAKITSKGQITIPKNIRTQLDVREGDEIYFMQTYSGLQLLTANERKEIAKKNLEALRRVQKAFEGVAEEIGLKNEDDVMKMIKSMREQGEL